MPEDDAIKRIESRLARLESAFAQVSPGVIVDPPVWGGGWGGWGGYGGWGGGRPGPIGDPAPIDYSRLWGGWRPPGPIGDPAPIDVSRLSRAQLEASLHSISAEKARLNSMETMITQQLARLKEQQG